MEARKAFVHLDCSRRVQKALLRNAQPIPRDYAVGDLVCFRRDNQIGGTKWSPACRVIGKESEKNVWLLCGNLPVLANAQNLRPASDAEALARSLLRGEMVEVPETVVGDQSQQQSFVDARRVVEETEGEESREKKSRRVETIPEGILEDPEEGTWEIPDDVLAELGILHQNELGEGNQEEEDQVEEEEDALAELHEAAASSEQNHPEMFDPGRANPKPREVSHYRNLEEIRLLDPANRSRGQEQTILMICLFSFELILRDKQKGMEEQKKEKIGQPSLHSWQTGLRYAIGRMKCQGISVFLRME